MGRFLSGRLPLRTKYGMFYEYMNYLAGVRALEWKSRRSGGLLSITRRGPGVTLAPQRARTSSSRSLIELARWMPAHRVADDEKGVGSMDAASKGLSTATKLR